MQLPQKVRTHAPCTHYARVPPLDSTEGLGIDRLRWGSYGQHEHTAMAIHGLDQPRILCMLPSKSFSKLQGECIWSNT